MHQDDWVAVMKSRTTVSGLNRAVHDYFEQECHAFPIMDMENYRDVSKRMACDESPVMTAASQRYDELLSQESHTRTRRVTAYECGLCGKLWQAEHEAEHCENALHPPYEKIASASYKEGDTYPYIISIYFNDHNWVNYKREPYNDL